MKQELLTECEKVIGKAVESALTSYNSPLIKAVNSALEDQSGALNNIANKSVSQLVESEEFRVVMESEMKKKLARVLISNFGGELEKSVNKLKQDPTTRAKITMAIDGVINDLINN